MAFRAPSHCKICGHRTTTYSTAAVPSAGIEEGCPIFGCAVTPSSTGEPWGFHDHCADTRRTENGNGHPPCTETGCVPEPGR
jgi:hypothetical protein